MHRLKHEPVLSPVKNARKKTRGRQFFLEKKLHPSGRMQLIDVDKEYGEILERMARSYNDIGQRFIVYHLLPHEWRHGFQNPRSRVTATVQLPA